MGGNEVRTRLKSFLSRIPDSGGPAAGLTTLIYHRVGGGTPDERDVATADFAAQCEIVARHRVVPLDQALEELAAGNTTPKVVLTFDDGFEDTESVALPILRSHGLPFTLYVATGYIGGQMHWDGSTAKATGPALSWDQVQTLADEPLCTLGNHTHSHVRPELLTESELDECTDALEERVGVTPRHFAYTWGIPVRAMEGALAARFDSAVTGDLGRDLPGCNPMRLHRIPVRQTDPLDFFQAKLTGALYAERAYTGVVATAKRAGMSA